LLFKISPLSFLATPFRFLKALKSLLRRANGYIPPPRVSQSHSYQQELRPLDEDALKNPIRRRILEILYARKVATPKELAEELGQKVPAVYYHLDLMKGLVSKNDKGEYEATAKGIDLIRLAVRDEMLTKIPIRRVAPYLAFIKYFSSPAKLLPIAVGVAVAEYAACLFIGLRPYLFGYSLVATDALPVYYIGNVFIMFLILEGGSFAVARRTGGEALLLEGVLVARLPLFLIIAAILLGPGPSIAYPMALAVGTILSLTLLALFTSLAKGIRPEIAVIISFVALYFDLFIYTLF
jgi:DNA-binding transcriptional ArsR family regulator